MSAVSPGAFSTTSERYLPMPSCVMPRETLMPVFGTSANLIVSFGCAQIASARSTPTLPLTTSNAAVNSMSRDVVAAEVDVHEPRDELVVAVGVLVVLDALEKRVGAVADADDRDAHLVLRAGLAVREPLVAAMGVSFPRPPRMGRTAAVRLNGTPSSSDECGEDDIVRVGAVRGTPRAWITSLSSSGMRRSTTGLEPGERAAAAVGS